MSKFTINLFLFLLAGCANKQISRWDSLSSISPKIPQLRSPVSVSDNNQQTAINEIVPALIKRIRIETKSVEKMKYPFCSRLAIKRGNKESDLSWCLSYEMMAYLSLFRATNSRSHLSEFLGRAEIVIQSSDDRLGFANEKKVWSSLNYSRNVPYPTLVGDGMITFPLVDFAFLVLSGSENFKRTLISFDGKRLSLSQLAQDFILLAKENVDFHEQEWNESKGGYRALPNTLGYFWDSINRPIANFEQLPFNMTFAMGRTLTRLCQLKIDLKSCEKTVSMIKNWRQNINLQRMQFSWPYWYFEAVPEDVNHGAIVVDFLRLTNEIYPQLKLSEDLTLIANQFSEKMYYAPGLVSYHVNGETPDTTYSSYSDTLLWMSISSFDRKIKFIGTEAIERLSAPLEGWHLYARALFEEYK